MDYLLKAIRSLRPTSQFSYDDNDYSTIVWNFIEGDAPTQAEIDAAIDQIKIDEITAETNKAAAKTAAEAKLAALGFTPDDLKALGLGAN
jgi:hypothetical protein